MMHQHIWKRGTDRLARAVLRAIVPHDDVGSWLFRSQEAAQAPSGPVALVHGQHDDGNTGRTRLGRGCHTLIPWFPVGPHNTAIARRTSALALPKE